MKNTPNKNLHTFLFICGFTLLSVICTMLASCKNTAAAEESEPAKTVAKAAGEIFVFYPPAALGDIFYYDNISYGLHDAAINNNLLVIEKSCKDWDEAKKNLEILSSLQEKKDSALVIFAHADFLNLLKSMTLDYSSLPQLLVLESREIENQSISTVYLPVYGAGYLAGRLLKEDTLLKSNMDQNRKFRTLCLLSDDKDPLLMDSLKGFSEGIGEPYGEIYDYDDIFIEESKCSEASKTSNLLVLKLDEKDNPSSVYSLVKIVQKSETPFDVYLPLCGSNVQGVLQYLRESQNGKTTIIGVNMDMHPYSQLVYFSMVKYLDKVLNKCVSQWVAEKKIPHYQEFGLKDGYTELYLPDNLSEELLDDLQSVIKASFETAVKKEREYEDTFKK